MALTRTAVVRPEAEVEAEAEASQMARWRQTSEAEAAFKPTADHDQDKGSTLKGEPRGLKIQ
jgi:hypothetical protein